jgi:DNA-directed RNA polymerase subunit RPC12/RpoP
MRSIRFRTESDHEQLQQLVDDYLSNGGTIQRTRDNRTVACPACGLRKRVGGVITKLGVRCPRCGSRMRC